MKPTRRDVLVLGGGHGGRRDPPSRPTSAPSADLRRAIGGIAAVADRSGDEYVWLSANADLPLFVAHDHPALFQVGPRAGRPRDDRRPRHRGHPRARGRRRADRGASADRMMVVGWDPSALIPAIDRAIDCGHAVVCVDADVPGSKRLAFIGTDWYDLGVRQGEAMLRPCGAAGRGRDARA